MQHSPVSATRTAVTFLAVPKVASHGSACRLPQAHCLAVWHTMADLLYGTKIPLTLTPLTYGSSYMDNKMRRAG